jgi:hypothetical protein
MTGRRIFDEDVIQSLVDRGYAGEADEFVSSDEGAASRFGKTVLIEIDGHLLVEEWETIEEAQSSFTLGKKRMRAAVHNRTDE